MTRKELEEIRIEAPRAEEEKRAQARWDTIAKPLDGLGVFERLIVRLGGILGEDRLKESARMPLKKTIVVCCADNGVVEEGVSQSTAEVTALVAKNLAAGKASVSRLAAYTNAYVLPVDVGMAEAAQGVRNENIRRGTRNFAKEPAMTEEETLAALALGIRLAEELQREGVSLLGLGEMGIGNTTTAAAITAALCGMSAEQTVGRGAGLSDAGMDKKRRIVREAIERYGLYDADAFTVLQTVGGLDIACLAGLCIGGGLYGLPVVLDGVITAAAAYAAERLCAGVRRYLFASHMGKEPAMPALLSALSLTPVLCAELALGEGTGAAMLFPLLEQALSLWREGTSFRETRMESYERFA